MSDGEPGLIRQAQKGDVKSFESLIRPHQTTLYRMALSITGNPDDAEDVFQETVVRAYRSIGNFRGDASFSTWLCRIVLNTGRNWVRSRSRASADRLAEHYTSSSKICSAGPEEDLISREQIRLMHQALLRLPDHYRDTLILRYYENLPYERIAEILCVPIGTVRSRLAQGRKCLVELLNAGEALSTENRR